jgi:hypothetical protein
VQVGAIRPGLSQQDLADQAGGTGQGVNAAPVRLLATEMAQGA